MASSLWRADTGVYGNEAKNLQEPVVTAMTLMQMFFTDTDICCDSLNVKK